MPPAVSPNSGRKRSLKCRIVHATFPSQSFLTSIVDAVFVSSPNQRSSVANDIKHNLGSAILRHDRPLFLPMPT